MLAGSRKLWSLLRRRAHIAVLLQTLPEGGIGIEWSPCALGVKIKVVSMIELETPEEAQRALVTPPEHVPDVPLHAQFLTANLVESEHGIHAVIHAELVETRVSGHICASA
jgi:hypothetical protein